MIVKDIVQMRNISLNPDFLNPSVMNLRQVSVSKLLHDTGSFSSEKTISWRLREPSNKTGDK